MSETKMDIQSISGSAKGLAKGVAIVDLLAASSRPMRQSDVVAASGIPHATAARLLDVLIALDLVRTDAQGNLALGSRVAGWGQAFLDDLDIARVGTDLIESLVEQTNETSFMGILDRGSVLYVAAISSPQPLRPVARVGNRNPLHCTGIGKVLLAYMDEERRTEVLSGELVQRTPNTITDPAALRTELEAVRARGFAIDEIENEDGVRCVAAPVRDHLGAVVAAISVSAPAYRFSAEDVRTYAPAVLAAADELSARMGYRSAASAPHTQHAQHTEGATR